MDLALAPIYLEIRHKKTKSYEFCYESTSVLDFKRILQYNGHTPEDPADISLFYGGTKLENDQDFRYYGITEQKAKRKQPVVLKMVLRQDREGG